jgi:hypothetical protein
MTTATGSPLTILCSGLLAGGPQHGGSPWTVLQYLLGFRRLGHTVYFVEPVQRTKLPTHANAELIHTVVARQFQRLAAAFELREHSALLLEGTTQTVGLPYESLREAAMRADVLINLGGALTDEALLAPIGRRMYVDLDPGFNQVSHLNHRRDLPLDAHTHFATVGLAVGRPDCRVPTCGRNWIATCPPVVLREWPVARGRTRNAFTTVATWRDGDSVSFEGLTLGQQADAMRPLMDLPKLTRARFELALAMERTAPDATMLQDNGWNLLDPRRAAGTPGSYRQFVSSSRAQFGITKSGYIAMQSGWFSDRSACYLSAGRPVLTPETGFGTVLPTGDGLVAFASTTEALAGLESIETHYARHRDAARAIAEEHFDSNRVLLRLLDRISA